MTTFVTNLSFICKVKNSFVFAISIFRHFFFISKFPPYILKKKKKKKTLSFPLIFFASYCSSKYKLVLLMLSFYFHISMPPALLAKQERKYMTTRTIEGFRSNSTSIILYSVVGVTGKKDRRKGKTKRYQ